MLVLVSPSSLVMCNAKYIFALVQHVIDTTACL